MIHFLKSALGDTLVRIVSSKLEQRVGVSDSIFGMPLSEAEENVRSDVLQNAQDIQYATVSVSHNSSDSDKPVDPSK